MRFQKGFKALKIAGICVVTLASLGLGYLLCTGAISPEIEHLEAIELLEEYLK